MKRLFFTGLLLLPVFLTGCLESAYRAGAPVTERSHGSTRTVANIPQIETQNKSTPELPQPIDNTPLKDKEVRIAVYSPPPRFKAEPVTSTAVYDLVQTAKLQKRQGNMTGAAATMERALRIEPRNAHLWNQLAQVRLVQGQYGQAENLASKSNALAAADRDLRRDNWLLIAKARRSAGNASGARLAENKANISR